MNSTVSLGLVSGLIGHLAKCVVLFEPGHNHRRRTVPANRLANLTSGAVLGIPLVYFIKKTGKDKHISKGTSFGMLLWAFSYSAKSNSSIDHYKNAHHKHRKNQSELRFFLSYLLFGVTTACTAVKLADLGTYPDDEYDFGF
jgi:hypothetical protein